MEFGIGKKKSLHPSVCGVVKPSLEFNTYISDLYLSCVGMHAAANQITVDIEFGELEISSHLWLERFFPSWSTNKTFAYWEERFLSNVVPLLKCLDIKWIKVPGDDLHHFHIHTQIIKTEKSVNAHLDTIIKHPKDKTNDILNIPLSTTTGVESFTGRFTSAPSNKALS